MLLEERSTRNRVFSRFYRIPGLGLSKKDVDPDSTVWF